MNGPAAPKDPEQKRPYFYIIKDKEIFGSVQEDGRGIQYLYQSDGRLTNSAQIVGNIEDENMLKLMETVDGFRKLVHSIGVSVETENPKEQVEVIFQMYGKNDIYGGVHYRDNIEYSMYRYAEGTCPKARELSEHIITLPMHMWLSDEEVLRIADIVNNFVK